jgi:hypothetical protein
MHTGGPTTLCSCAISDPSPADARATKAAHMTAQRSLLYGYLFCQASLGLSLLTRTIRLVIRLSH